MVRRIAFFAACVALLAPQSAHAGPTGVTIDDNFFTPTPVTVPVGQAVKWLRDSGALGFHNVVQRRGLFDSGPATNDSGFTFTRRFSAGSFGYICEVHFISDDMTGSVKVPPTFAERPDGRPFTVRWANSETNTGNVFDVQYRVDGGTWRMWKTDTTRFKAVFGKDGNPVRVRPGHRYDFRARSQRTADSPEQRSGWSPLLTVRP